MSDDLNATPVDYAPPSPSPSPLRELLGLAAPTVAQMASYTLMQFLDVWMLAHYGHNRETGIEPTAAMTGGMFAFSVLSIGFGTLMVVNTLVSQSFGRNDRAACGRYLWQGIWFSLLYWLLVLALVPGADRIFAALGHPPELVRPEAAYFRIMVACTVLKLVQTALAQFMLAIDRPVSVLMATVCGVSVNALAAWAMIFGHLGFAPMGLRGSAWGQNVGLAVELGVLVLLAVSPRVWKTYGLRDWRLHWDAFRRLLVVGLPSGVQIVADVLAWSLFSVWVMAPYGTVAIAANTFTFRFFSVSFMPAYGISVAVTALVGRYIGRGEPEVASARARLGFIVSAAYMLTCGAVFFAGRNVLMGIFTDNPEILRIGAVMLIYAAVYQFFDAMYVCYNGALRGAGDTLFPAVLTGVLCWGITVVGGRMIATYRPEWGPGAAWGVATTYGVLLGVFIYGRWARGAWRKISLEGGETRGFEIVATA